MKKGLHPESYRPVVFKDMSNGDMFLSRSTVATKETIEFEGETYPLLKIEISNTSHPFYTGKSTLVDTAGRVDKFMSRYGDRKKKYFDLSWKMKKEEILAENFVFFRFLYSLASSIIHQEIGYMTMPDTLHIILPQVVHANYIFRIMVVNGEQRSKLPLNSGLWS